MLGLGCALVPRKTILRELNDKTLETVEVKGLSIKRPIGVLYPGGKGLHQNHPHLLRNVDPAVETLDTSFRQTECLGGQLDKTITFGQRNKIAGIPRGKRAQRLACHL